jgi:uncharacterized OB-fold protein
MGLTERIASNEQIGAWEGHFPLEHRYTVGVAGERVLRELKDNGRFLGTRCPRCQVTYAPARLYCERCLSRLDEWLPIPLVGKLASYTVVHRDVEGERLSPPLVVGLIELDGATGGFVHRVGGVDPGQLRLGQRVAARLRPAGERTGSINDVEFFQPVT